MRLLVSVRDANEAERATAGGADIVDAKEPSRGSLGSVSGPTLEAIRRAVPEPVRLSAALGDVAGEADVALAFDAVHVPTAFVKVGFRGLDDRGLVTRLLRRAVLRAGSLPGHPAVIAVGYADHVRAGTLAPGALAELLPVVGADGLLIDTCFKDGGDLFAHLPVSAVSAIATRLAADELTLAVGGSLDARHITQARETGAAIFGVRGAVCPGGRNGAVEEERVRRLAEAIRAEPSAIGR
jgi:uncharacterized protein (UPF0264 family)